MPWVTFLYSDCSIFHAGAEPVEHEEFVSVGAACSRDGALEARLQAAPTDLASAQRLGGMQLLNLNEYGIMDFCNGIALRVQPVFCYGETICSKIMLAFIQQICILAAVSGEHRGTEWLR
jgi:hypothetical protein